MATDKPIEVGKSKPFIVANVREVLDQYNREEISYSRMVELFNEIAFKYFQSPSLPVEQGEVKALADVMNLDAFINKLVQHNEGVNPNYKMIQQLWWEAIEAIQKQFRSTPPDNSNTRIIEYLKGKLEEYDYNRYLTVSVTEIKRWIAELEAAEYKKETI